MEEKKEIPDMLELMTCPGFYVKDHIITRVNSAAAGLLLSPGMDVRELIPDWQGEYENLTSGCLCLQLSHCGTSILANVICMAEQTLFLLDQETEHTELQALALAARELRKPLSSVMGITDLLLAEAPDATTKAQAARLNRGLYQLLRIIGNMSATESLCAMETRDIGALVDSILEKASALIGHTGITLRYTPLEETIICLTDADLLERAVLNILSNAIKFTPKGGSIEVCFRRLGRTLRLSIQDSGSGMAEAVRGDLFKRYLRQPGIEDSRYGLGLGMVLVRNAATRHSGTVLVDRVGEMGTRVTLTLAIQQSSGTALRSPVLLPDYTGGRDRALVELSDCLPPELYDNSF